MKKALAITLACVMAAGVLGGCSGKGGEKTTEGVTGGNSEAATEAEKGEKTESAASGEKTIIHYYDWVTMDTSIIDEFNAANPDIEVQYHAIPDNGSDKLTQLDILAMGGGEIDVMPGSDGEQMLRMKNGMYAPIDEFIEKDGIDMEKNFGGILSYASYDGVTYGYPIRSTIEGIWYKTCLTLLGSGIRTVPGHGMNIRKSQRSLPAVRAIPRFTERTPTPLTVSGLQLVMKSPRGIQKTENVISWQTDLEPLWSAEKNWMTWDTSFLSARLSLQRPIRVLRS